MYYILFSCMIIFSFLYFLCNSFLLLFDRFFFRFAMLRFFLELLLRLRVSLVVLLGYVWCVLRFTSFFFFLISFTWLIFINFLFTHFSLFLSFVFRESKHFLFVFFVSVLYGFTHRLHHGVVYASPKSSCPAFSFIFYVFCILFSCFIWTLPLPTGRIH